MLLNRCAIFETPVANVNQSIDWIHLYEAKHNSWGPRMNTGVGRSAILQVSRLIANVQTRPGD